MPLAFQGSTGTAIDWSLVTKIEVTASGGSAQDIGRFKDVSGSIEEITVPCDPADSPRCIALRIQFSFTGIQTGKSNELTNLDDTAGTGLFDTLCSVKFTFANTRTLTLGGDSSYPLFLHGKLNFGDDGKASSIEYTANHVEPYTNGIAGKFSA